jgi:hypothetical protein
LTKAVRSSVISWSFFWWKKLSSTLRSPLVLVWGCSGGFCEWCDGPCCAQRDQRQGYTIPVGGLGPHLGPVH